MEIIISIANFRKVGNTLQISVCDYLTKVTLFFFFFFNKIANLENIYLKF